MSTHPPASPTLAPPPSRPASPLLSSPCSPTSSFLHSAMQKALPFPTVWLITHPPLHPPPRPDSLLPSLLLLMFLTATVFLRAHLVLYSLLSIFNSPNLPRLGSLCSLMNGAMMHGCCIHMEASELTSEKPSCEVLHSDTLADGSGRSARPGSD